jgi:hypothetical protein
MIRFIGAWRLKKNMKKTRLGMMGFSSNEEDPIALGDDKLGRAGHKSEGGEGSLLLDDLAKFDDDENIPAVVPVGPPAHLVPSPLRRSSCRVIQSSSDASGKVNVQPPPAARSGAPPLSIANSTVDLTPPSVNDDVIHSAMAKASSRLIASKTKNLSN